MRLSTIVGLLLAAPAAGLAARPNPVPAAINRFGIELLRFEDSAGAQGNSLLSPYSIETALAMAYFGADSHTRTEMQRVLHLPSDDGDALDGFSALAREFGELQAASRRDAEPEGGDERGGEAIEINVANRLFAQRGFAFRPAFTATLRERFDAPLDELDFIHAAEPARVTINDWVAHDTHDRIRDLIPAGAIGDRTRAVLANALYLRAPWAHAFEVAATENEPFWVRGTVRAEVPTMIQRRRFGYEKRKDYGAIALPYLGGTLQFVILLPDRRDGLADLEQSVTPDDLAACARLPRCDVVVHLPKFKLEPPVLPLGPALRGLGMTTAFDDPPGSADFDRMAPRQPDDYLRLSEVFHRTWLSLDENGTEAAAASAVVAIVALAVSNTPPPPIEVRVDRPFLFAIQHVPSGTCLFLGRVEDPR